MLILSGRYRPSRLGIVLLDQIQEGSSGVRELAFRGMDEVDFSLHPDLVDRHADEAPRGQFPLDAHLGHEGHAKVGLQGLSSWDPISNRDFSEVTRAYLFDNRPYIVYTQLNPRP